MLLGENDQASFRVRVAHAVAGEGWVVDGCFSGLTFDLTLARADTLIETSGGLKGCECPRRVTERAFRLKRRHSYRPAFGRLVGIGVAVAPATRGDIMAVAV